MMTTRLFRACVGILLAFVYASAAPVPVAAQAPVQKRPAAAAKKNEPAAKKPQATAVTSPEPAPPPAVERLSGPETFSYRSEGRRDPFLSLVNRVVMDNRPAQKKPEGLRGLSWDEVVLRGIFQSRTGIVALVQAPDTKTYRVRVGDQFYDAVVKGITSDSLIVLQEVNDPLSLQKQRERRKTLRVAEEVK